MKWRPMRDDYLESIYQGQKGKHYRKGHYREEGGGKRRKQRMLTYISRRFILLPLLPSATCLFARIFHDGNGTTNGRIQLFFTHVLSRSIKLHEIHVRFYCNYRHLHIYTYPYIHIFTYTHLYTYIYTHIHI